MDIHPGDIYWLLSEGGKAGGEVVHPHVVLEMLDGSGSPAVLACPLTTNLKRVSMPGNVLLEAGEANLPSQSVVEVGKMTALPVNRLGEYIGRLSEQRVKEIFAGNHFVRALRRPAKKAE